MTVTPSCFTTEPDPNGDPLMSVCVLEEDEIGIGDKKRRRKRDLVMTQPIVTSNDGVNTLNYTHIRATKVNN